ncbi:MAG TPA: SDR family NAD(P)-dependent oxidoreductase [Pseudomonadales bacterium]
MSLLAVVKGTRGKTGFGFASTAEEVCAGLDLSARTVLITGVNSGLGYESARVLGARGAHVIGLARSEEKAAAALAQLAVPGTAVACELAEPASVRAAVEIIGALGRPLDAVIANAGIMALPSLNQAHGYELQFFTNHIGHFILVTGLLGQLAERARVVVLSSAGHKFAPRQGVEFDNLSGAQGYSGWRAYGQSKLCNVLFSRMLARRLAGTGRTANAVHPGGIDTNLGRHIDSPLFRLVGSSLAWIGMKSIGQGAATQCYVAVHPDAERITGEYWADCNVAPSSALARDDALAERLWQVSEEIAARL